MMARMHRSRLSTFVLDCKTADLDAAAGFWSQALGRPWKRQPDNDPLYRELEASTDEPILLVQKVEHDSRIHLDIEADDQEAEARRLEALGARRVAWVRNWFVMEAPTGQRFCIVKPQRGALDGKTNVKGWP
jgi:glyoxalase superfamily protein